MTSAFVRTGFCLAAMFACTFAARISHAETSDVKLEVIGVMVSKPIPQPGAKKKDDGQMASSSMFGGVGTHVHVYFSDAKRMVLGLVDEESKIECTDDKGTRLGADKDDKKGGIRFGMPEMTDRKDDGNPGLVVEIRQEKVPVKGATKVRIKGTIAVLCGSGEDVIEQKDVAIKDGTKVKAGNFEFSIESVRDQGFGDVKGFVEFTSKQPFDGVKEIEFLDKAGKVIKQEGNTSGKFGFAGNMTYSKSIGLHQKVDKATLRIKKYKTVETVKVPVDVEIGLGF